MKFSNNGFRKMENGDNDQRVRVSVFLVSHQRPKYWNFHCNYCGTKVAELSGQVALLSDVDESNRTKSIQPILIRCPGNYCRMWYELNLGA